MFFKQKNIERKNLKVQKELKMDFIIRNIQKKLEKNYQKFIKKFQKKVKIVIFMEKFIMVKEPIILIKMELNIG